MSNPLMIFGGLILIVLVAVTGIVLSHMGRPLNTAVFTIHKLIALGFVIFSVVGFINLIKGSEAVDPLLKTLLIVAACSAVLLFVTGGLLSFDKFAKKFIVVFHAVLTAVVAGSAGTSLYLFLKK
ncbi:MAG TPA: hypothetical protein PK466_12740 [Thermotogota bacterium]|nr:hypothetical protein [Thermotogota bacterium]HPJ88729.1 hypothetical protein [Thermotogota bacterium]HPR97189.1 hypothetical protein [Thermotogota bacterium]